MEKEENRMNVKRLFAVAMAGILCLSDVSWAETGSLEEAEQGQEISSYVPRSDSGNFQGAKSSRGVAERTEDEIRAYFRSHPFDENGDDTWEVTPDAGSETEGRLSSSSIENGLNALNFIRYAAGLSPDVTLNEDYGRRAQAGTALLTSAGTMTHTPKKPEGVSEDFYQSGYSGTSASNLATGYSNLARAIMGGWMFDGSLFTITSVGHRRWCLDPRMRQTGFGHSGEYTAMYVFDGAGSDYSGDAYDYVPWPAKKTPVEYFCGPWSVSLSPDAYKVSSDDPIRVTLKNPATGKTYVYDNLDKKGGDGYLHVSTEGYGYGSCIIFQVDEDFCEGEQVSVEITGLRDRAGAERSISYTVSFFAVEPARMEELKLLPEYKLLDVGESWKLGGTPVPLNATDAFGRYIKWSSSNEAVATVEGSKSFVARSHTGIGYVTALSAGSTVITAELNGKTATCAVTVRDPKSAITMNVDSKTLDVKESCQLSVSLSSGGGNDIAGNVKWESNDEAVAAVDDNGKVTAVAEGQARVLAWLDNNAAYCDITVKNTRSKTGSGGNLGSTSGSGVGSSVSSSGSSSGSNYRSSSGGTSTSTTSSAIPSYVIRGTWSLDDGHWRLADSSGKPYRDCWVAAYNPYASKGQLPYDWFHFDASGRMMIGWLLDKDGHWYYLNPSSDGAMGKMMTGWAWIRDGDGVERCYYLNPHSDGYRGRMVVNAVVDGYDVDGDGHWVANGIVQAR